MKKCDCDPPKALEIKCPGEVILFRKVEIPAEMGDDVTYPPRPGMYRNVLLVYKANNHVYMYSSDGMPTFISDGGEGTKDYEDLINKPSIDGYELSGDVTLEDIGVIDAIDDALEEYTPTDELADVALSGDYDDLINKPTIPTVNDATLTITRNNVSAGTFTANSATDTSINIAVPTATSDLTNDSGFIANTVDNLVNYYTKTETDSAIGVETTNREGADQDLQEQIDALASASDVVDVVGTYAELQAYDTSHLNDNDIIKVLTDETHNDAISYYRWDTDTDTFSYIGSQGPFYTKAESDATFVPQTRTVNNKALSSNITLTAADVHALPDSTVIPTVNNATLTIKKNGTNVATFTANSATDTAADISVPTATSELDNDSGYVTGEVTTTCTQGEEVTINNALSYSAPITDMALIGKSVQNAYKGVNLINTNALVRLLPYTTTSRGITYTINLDGSVVVNGTNDRTGNSVIYIYNQGNPLSLPEGDYVGCINPANGIYENVAIVTYNGSRYASFKNAGDVQTLSGDIQMYIQVPNGNTTTFENYKIYPMIEAGTTQSEYEPYVGNLPSPRPDWGQLVNTVGGINTVQNNGQTISAVSLGNLMNISQFELGGMTAGARTGERYRITNADNAIPVEPNTTYTLSAELGTGILGMRCGLHQCDIDGRFLNDSGWRQLASAPYTFTTRSDTYFVKLTFSLSTTSANVTTGGTENVTNYTSVSSWLRGCYFQLNLGSSITTPVELASVTTVPLPSEYQKVDYIESTNKGAGQIINLDYFTTATTQFSIDYEITSAQNTNSPIFGSRVNSNASDKTKCLVWAQYYGSSAGKEAIVYGSVDSSYVTGTNAMVRHTVSNIQAYMYYNGTRVYTATAEKTTSTLPLALFGMCDNNYLYDARSNAMKFYGLKLYESGALSANFVPCYRKSDDAVGVYDTVRQAFYTSREAGKLSKGDDINDDFIDTLDAKTLKNTNYVGKIHSYNGEVITTPYVSSLGYLTTGAAVYYGLKTPTENTITDNDIVKTIKPLLVSLPVGENVITTQTVNAKPDLRVCYQTSELSELAFTSSYDDIVDKPTLAAVATSGSYNDLANKPTIPTVNNATLTIQKNGVNVTTFTANSATNATANIVVPTKTSDLTNDGADNTSTYVEADELAAVATSGSYNDLTDKPADFELVEMSYGESNAWAKFITAYQGHKIVYCRASSNSNPATGTQGRKAFMAYVNNAENPTEVEFQYVRSVSAKTSSQPVDQVFVYKLTNANGGTWTVTTRDMGPKLAQGTNTTVSYSNGTYTVSATQPTVNDATLTIKKNGSSVGTFTANASSSVDVDITVPTKTSDITNDSGYIDNTVSNLTNYYDQTTVNNMFNALTIPTKTSDLTNDSGFVTDTDYASANDAGVIKVGSGLSIDNSGVLSTTGLQSVDWTDVTNKPTNVSYWTNDAGYITSSVNNLTNYYKKSETYTQGEVNSLLNAIVIPTKTSDLTNDGSDGTAAYLETDETAYKTASIPYGVCDNTSTSTVYTATVPGITELRDGVCMWLKNGVVTSVSGFTININNLGAKPVYNNMAAATRDTTIWNVNYTMFFVYDSTRVEGGCWILYRGYNSDNNTIGYQLRTNSTSLTTTDRTRYYRILFTSADNTHWVPANTQYDNSATSNKTINQRKINPFGRIVYLGNSTSYLADAAVSATAVWDQYAFSLGYSFSKGSALTMTYPKPVYVKCAPQTDGSAIIDSTTPFVQDLPTTDDGKIYIYLGIAYSATNIEMVINHPIYYYKDGAIREWSNAPAAIASVAWGDITGTLADQTDLNTALGAKANSADLATVATSGSYNDLSNKPTIPTVNNATLTIQKNGTTVKTFTANASSNVTANITVPTTVAELSDSSNYATTTDLAAKQNLLSPGNHIDITSDVISATGYVHSENPQAAAAASSTITGSMIASGTITADKLATGATVQLTLSSSDIGEGSPLAANTLYGVYI